MNAACVLDFNAYPYKPVGDCLQNNKKVLYWNSIPSTLCCQNVLTSFSKSLALHAHTTNHGNIFIEENLWTNCSGSFHRQRYASVPLCGLDNFFYGGGECSKLSLEVIQNKKTYQTAVAWCSGFNPSFDDACSACYAAVSSAIESMLEELRRHDDDNEKAVCGFAVVTSIAATLLNDSYATDDFYRCLSALDVIEPGYFKVKNILAKALLAIIIATITLIFILVLIKYLATNKNKNKNKNKSNMRRKSPLKNVDGKEVTFSSLYRFNKDEIENAINLENGRQYLGRGSAGQVYKGYLPSGQAVAIKHINKSSSSDSFVREVEGLSRIRHPNLVCLFGVCIEDGEQYLVYEYCAAGNLAQHLLRKDTALTWEKRVKILRDCALALRYLHHYIDGCIVHRDIKLTNILLTENLEAKLSDFGLARMLGMEESKVFTDVRGTIGYMDPEYMSNAKLTCASDIYSFGIVTLQLLSGQRVIELDLDAREHLTRKAKDVSMGRRPLTDFEDPRLNGNVNSADFESILHIAVLCIAKSSKGRPTIDVVFEEIEKAWKNTVTEMKSNVEINSTETSMAKSMEVIPV
ncbi:probable leucine-rich repeat receptor-like protein kinase At5g49770 [Carica papaya]|uniref:probable leucine-rich repeat receptor-like protein kinase At5g49770 n=1 Tax=Carica papaya TaxID=3649 RepID=UPI000B8C8BD3|nr:probable leucine-rich repeat receptor-like protein kinase At5g49770 [Carica papaya]